MSPQKNRDNQARRHMAEEHAKKKPLKRTLMCTKRSSMASAAVVFPFITSYQSDTGNCEIMIVAFCPCLSSIISIKSSNC